LITSASANDGDWKNVVENWRSNTSKTELTKEGENWVLVIPNMYDYYKVSTSTEIKKLAFVFHDGPGGSKEGKTAEGTDIFVELAEPGLAVNIATSLQEMTTIDTELTLNCYATESAELTLKLNGEVVKTATGLDLTYTHTFSQGGQHDFELTATNASGTATATASTWVPAKAVKQNRPAGIVNGIYYDETDPTKVTLCTYAGCKMAPSSTESSITVKAKMPAHWTNTITAWVWTAEDANGKAITPTQEGDWYVVTENCVELNIIFKNGEGWNGDPNQTVDIKTSENTCYELASDGATKATATAVDCE
jgi:hypothetical protein